MTNRFFGTCSRLIPLSISLYTVLRSLLCRLRRTTTEPDASDTSWYMPRIPAKLDFVPARPEVSMTCLYVRLLNILRYFGIIISDMRTCFLAVIDDFDPIVIPSGRFQ